MERKYLINGDTGAQLFFYKNYEGICALNLREGHSERERVICHDGGANFFVYQSGDGAIQLITESASSGLIYMLCRNNEWHRYDIGGINADLKVKKIMIGANKLGQSLFYSALYHGEYILVHCVLGDNAMPSTVDKLFSEDFFIYNMRVYYTNEKGIMGYQSFADGKPLQFVYCGEGEMPYACNVNGKNYLTYKKGASIIVNGRVYAEDIASEYPVICKNADKTMLVWKSRDFIRAVPIENEEMSRTVQSSAYGTRPELFVMSDGIACKCFYAVFSAHRLKMFHSENPFSKSRESKLEIESARLRAEVEELNKKLEELETENGFYKKEIVRLNEILQNKAAIDE